jgi:hypothetical protein
LAFFTLYLRSLMKSFCIHNNSAIIASQCNMGMPYREKPTTQQKTERPKPTTTTTSPKMSVVVFTTAFIQTHTHTHTHTHIQGNPYLPPSGVERDRCAISVCWPCFPCAPL